MSAQSLVAADLQEPQHLQERYQNFEDPKNRHSIRPAPHLRTIKAGYINTTLRNTFFHQLASGYKGLHINGVATHFPKQDRMQINSTQAQAAVSEAPTEIFSFDLHFQQHFLYLPEFLNKINTKRHTLFLGFNIHEMGLLQYAPSYTNNTFYFFIDMSAGLSVMDALEVSVLKKPLYIRTSVNINLVGASLFRPLFLSVLPFTLTNTASATNSIIRPLHPLNYQELSGALRLEYPFLHNHKNNPRRRPPFLWYLMLSYEFTYNNSHINNIDFTQQTHNLSIGTIMRLLR